MKETPKSISLREWLWLAAILLLTGAVYGQVLGFPFVNFDDDVHVFENRHVRTGLSYDNLLWAFGIHGPSQWHPLAWLSHQLDSECFGTAAGGPHAVSVLLHLCNVVLVFVLLLYSM